MLKREKKETHTDLMKEQQRTSKNKTKVRESIAQRKWPTIVSNAKALRAEQTTGIKKTAINKKKQHMTEQLVNIRLPELILHKFSLSSKNILKRHYSIPK